MLMQFLRAHASGSSRSSSQFFSLASRALTTGSAALVAASLVAGCSMPRHPDASAPPTDPYNPAATQLLDDTHWDLLSWKDASGQPRVIPQGGADGQPLSLDFSTESGRRRASGYSGCNRFTGTYSLKDGKLAFGPLAGTRMACVQGVGGKVEQPYLDALAHVAKSGVQMNSPKALELTTEDGQILTFTSRAK